mmetsp:Transcript_10707/g.25264  ORF Transcript_10707/g.25264 Transcript_10707/m.25264 type:complete len:492 (+) Transcript_10707:178-1653(+)
MMQLRKVCLVLVLLLPNLSSAFVHTGLTPLRRHHGYKAVCKPRMSSSGGWESPSIEREQAIIDVSAISTELPTITTRSEVEQLKVQLKQAVTAQKYSEAAVLQAKIRAAEQNSDVGISDTTSELQGLKRMLAEAVANEMYAEAAELKEKIQSLEVAESHSVVSSGGQAHEIDALRARMNEAAENGLYAAAAQIQEDIKGLEEQASYQLTATRGPMQTYKLRKPAKRTELVLTPEERQRENNEPDYLFYQEPRFSLYVDLEFAKQLQKLYAKRIMPGSAILDLGAACATYLPEDVKYREVCGLGMNMEEMEANEELTARVVHDLNEDATLPYMDEQFDAVLLSNSLPYFSEPERVLEEAARVLRPGGVIIVSFTDRCIASKVTNAWSSRGNLDRATLVQDLVRACPSFTPPEQIWEVNPLSSAGVMLPSLRGATGGDPFMAVVSYKEAPPPGWALQVVGESSALGTVQAGPFKGITPFAAMYMLYLLINHAH